MTERGGAGEDTSAAEDDAAADDGRTLSPTQSQITAMDGNVEPTDAAVTHLTTNKIRININTNVSKIVVANENTVKLTEPSSSAIMLQQQPQQQHQQHNHQPYGGVENNNEANSRNTYSYNNDGHVEPTVDDIAFEYKTSMVGVAFQRTPIVRGGRRETSGLCSIM